MTQLNLKFWGVMGSTPGATSPTLLKYGTNTSCVSVECEDELVIFDAGTGIVQLASYLNAKNTINIYICLLVIITMTIFKDYLFST